MFLLSSFVPLLPQRYTTSVLNCQPPWGKKILTTIQGLKKTIPGTPENVVPVHLRPKQQYAQYSGPQY